MTTLCVLVVLLRRHFSFSLSFANTAGTQIYDEHGGKIDLSAKNRGNPFVSLLVFILVGIMMYVGLLPDVFLIRTNSLPFWITCIIAFFILGIIWASRQNNGGVYS